MKTKNVNLLNTRTVRNSGFEIPLICEILFTYNCRISEVLSAERKNFFPGKFLILLGKKHSANIIIRDRKILADVENLFRFRDDLLFVSNTYNNVYSFFKKNFSHYYNSVSTRKNKHITHFTRYFATQNISDEEILKNVLHHNSKKSNHFYKNKIRSI